MLLNACDLLGEPLIFAAVKNRNVYLTRLLLVKGATPNTIYRGDTPLTLAIKHCYTDIAECIIKFSDVNVHQTDICKNTPLCIAASCGNEDIIEPLLRKGACPHDRNNQGEPVFFTLARRDLNSGVVAILQAGADITTTDSFGRTLLYYLLQHRCEDSFLLWIRYDIPFTAPKGYPSLLEIATEGSMYFAAKSILLMDRSLYHCRSLRALSGERLIHVAFRNNHTLLAYYYLHWEAGICIQKAWKQYKHRKKQVTNPEVTKT